MSHVDPFSLLRLRQWCSCRVVPAVCQEADPVRPQMSTDALPEGAGVDA